MDDLEVRPTFASPGIGPSGDIVVVGAGLAGLFTALKLAPMPVTVIATEALGEGTSSGWAQGGIAAAVSEGDSPEAHAHDTILAGAGIVEPKIANLLASEAPQRIDDLLRYGVPFDRDLEGKLQLSREAAHSARRVVRVRGDMAGKAIMSAITMAARNTPSIRVIEGFAAHEIAAENGRAVGVHLWPSAGGGTGDSIFLPARAIVLASGGTGQLYAMTTNPGHARGGGLAMAARAGAVIADAEFVQFHPTALAIGRDPAPLATEALRGEGATLVNAAGDRFMTRWHADAELAPRDVVARAVHEEVQSGRGAFLDCRKAVGERFAEAFPGIYEVCRTAGIDPAREPLPVAPAAHYHMGGVLTDANGRSTVDGLWACGEVASTGAHGANRLASNSLLETVVFGARIAEDLLGLLPAHGSGRPIEPSTGGGGAPTPQAITRLRAVMSAKVGVVRERHGLAEALSVITDIEADEGLPIGFRNMALAARFIAAAGWAREESRGGHFRKDFPQPDETLAKRSYLTLARSDDILHEALPAPADNVIRAAFGS
ncbi:MAG: L-aspartate oxidase [Pseudomonadota bacterium]|nr:L-aspartate oxidase [Pseudomonadota bacterium]